MPRHIIHIYLYIYTLKCRSNKHEDSDNPSLDRNNNTMMKIMEVATKDCQVCQAKPILKSFEPHYDCKQRDHRCRKTCCCTSSSCAAVRLEGDFTIPPPLYHKISQINSPKRKPKSNTSGVRGKGLGLRLAWMFVAHHGR